LQIAKLKADMQDMQRQHFSEKEKLVRDIVGSFIFFSYFYAIAMVCLGDWYWTV